MQDPGDDNDDRLGDRLKMGEKRLLLRGQGAADLAERP
jgi:hypothetical protein